MSEPATAIPPHATQPPDDEAEARRDWHDFLLLWRLCQRQTCRRARACRGDARQCTRHNGALLPDGVKKWFGGVTLAKQGGYSFDEAMEWLDGTEAGQALRAWCRAVSLSLGEQPHDLPERWWRHGREDDPEDAESAECGDRDEAEH